MARTSTLAAICIAILPFAASAQENAQQQPLPGWLRFLNDVGFEGAILGALVVGVLTIIGVYLASRMTRGDARRQVVRELEKEFVYGHMLRARLNAELLLAHDTNNRYANKNFKEMYEDETVMAKADYADVAAVLNLFRLLDEYKKAKHIDENDARAAFGWIYRWWWEKVIRRHIAGLENDDDWRPIISRKAWLLKEYEPWIFADTVFVIMMWLFIAGLMALFIIPLMRTLSL